uniref:Uncharacterized protein n=1 Tax=Ascaris lumbricoides TaxID=6252 RepID=A0A0M3HHX0_ASCLU
MIFQRAILHRLSGSHKIFQPYNIVDYQRISLAFIWRNKPNL